jgi:hypothetical protein
MKTICATKILEGLELKLCCLELFDILNFQELQMTSACSLYELPEGTSSPTNSITPCIMINVDNQ